MAHHLKVWQPITWVLDLEAWWFKRKSFMKLNLLENRLKNDIILELWEINLDFGEKDNYAPT